MSDRLDPDVAAAIAGTGLAVRRVRELSTIRSPGIGRAVYRLDLASGSTIKLRTLENEDTARRLFDLQQRLPCGFLRAFRRQGRVLFEEWIEGEVLGHRVPHGTHLVDGAALLAALHTTPWTAPGLPRARTQPPGGRTPSGVSVPFSLTAVSRCLTCFGSATSSSDSIPIRLVWA